MGAYQRGGRWNSKGTYMLYTSENSSLALLENLVHFDKSLMPPNLYIMHLEIEDTAGIFTLDDVDYPVDWKRPGLLENQESGDRWMKEKHYLAIKVKSAINELEFNYLLNPLFPRYHDLIKVVNVTALDVDSRL